MNELLTDTTHGLVVNVEATTDAIDYRQLEPALNRCQTTLGRMPKQIVADGDYTNHTSVKAAETAGVDFYGDLARETWKPTEHDAHGRGPAFMASAFSYDAERDIYLCPAGEKLTHHAIYNDKNGVRRHVYKQPRSAWRTPRPVCFEKASGQLEAIDYTHGRTACNDCLQGQDEDRRSEADL